MSTEKNTIESEEVCNLVLCFVLEARPEMPAFDAHALRTPARRVRHAGTVSPFSLERGVTVPYQVPYQVGLLAECFCRCATNY